MKRVRHRNRAEWIRWRMGGIGGSDAPAIMNASKFTTKENLWAEKLGLKLPDPMNYPMRRGIKLEPEARAAHENLIGVRMAAANFSSTRHPWALASLDGYNEEHGIVAEYKCPLSKEDLKTAREGKVPEHYKWQLVHILMVLELPEIQYGSYDGATGELSTAVFKRDLKLERALAIEERKFWKCVVTGTPPWDVPEEKPKNVIEMPKPFEFKTRRNRK